MSFHHPLQAIAYSAPLVRRRWKGICKGDEDSQGITNSILLIQSSSSATRSIILAFLDEAHAYKVRSTLGCLASLRMVSN